MNLITFFCLILCLIHFGSTSDGFGTCDDLEWKCKNDQCIDVDELCDGKRDCSDGSDETSESCVLVRCPSFAFRCSYGACVDGDAECNGVKDCEDNSDENSRFCSTGLADRFGGSGERCSLDQFECKNGQCINAEATCDGKADCADKSDETVEKCSAVYCPTYSFRCAYGACIGGDDKCNKVIDCLDGSDEIEALCGLGWMVVNHTVETTPSRPVFGPSEQSCPIPELPHVITESDAMPDTIFKSGDNIRNFGSIKYRCPSKYVLLGDQTNFCYNGNFTFRHPLCLRHCNPIHIAGITFKAQCEKKNGEGIPCDRNLFAGTRAKISCNVGYVRPETSTPTPDIIICGEDGEWDYSPFRCIPNCGTEPVQGTPFGVGQSINNSYIPWNIGIYSKRKSTKYEHICGGTIINAKIVVSAAHCFWDDENKKPHDPSFYAIAAGKYYRDYYADENLGVQKLNVSEIIILRGYDDLHLSYNYDFAILVLNKYIEFQFHIKPICMLWNLPHREKVIKPPTVGKVAGWGQINALGNYATELQLVELIVVDDDTCIKKAGPQYRNLITGDKFCVTGNQNDNAVCQGDSGAGFAISRMVNGVPTYYLWGVVSVALTDKGKCGGDFYTTFTNVQLYSDRLLDAVTDYRPR